MADCSASGTAIDRVVQTAVASALNHAGNNAPTSSVAAASAATQVVGNLALGVGNNSNMLGGSVSGQQVMPLAPLEMIGGGGGSAAIQHHEEHMFGDGAARLDEYWAASAASSNNAQPMNHHTVHSHNYQQQQMVHLQHQHSAASQMMMQQQQQQMMMMQQMQLQQQQMAAMVQHKKAMEAQQQSASIGARAESTADDDTITVVDDDVATVSEEEQLNHEGITEDASIERLARAWREAEAEFAEEFEGDEYDVSDMGGIYSENYQTRTVDDTATNNATEPHYDFSEASRTYASLQAPTADNIPSTLEYPADLYDRGLRYFTEGDLRSAILCFESMLQNVDPEHADAWRMLGKCHTENDDDRKAIACLVRSLERDPFSSETLLLTAVAHVNELDHERALATLRSWVAHHPLYAGMANGLDDGQGVEEEEDLYGDAEEFEGSNGVHHTRTKTRAEMRQVERLLLRALDHDSTADAASDVYEALGVVYNVSQDYDAAVSAFRRAIKFRPNDYQLRNKLGATLANGNRSEEALPAYGAALRLKPKYARGFLNMAIAHSNLHNYSESARCYLQTLSLNPEALHVWSYLRIALTCDERWDLLPLAAEQNLSGFREHFDFVEY